MDKYLVAAGVLAAVLVLLLLAESVFATRDAEVASFETRNIVIHCKTVHEANGEPFPGVMIYASGSTISDAKGECTITAEGDKFVRLIVYPPKGSQKIVTVPVSPGEDEVNVVIPI